MKALARWNTLSLARGLAAAVALAVLAGCAGGTAPGAAGWTPVPITDMKSVAGKWEGTLTRAQGPKDDWLELTIREDGTYDAVSTRLIGVFRGSGRFALADGKLRFQGERGSGVVGLATRGAERRLDVRLTNREGVETASSLVPVR